MEEKKTKPGIFKNIPMVHLGKEPGSKAYKLYNPKSKKVVVARDVSFDESKSWTWETTQGSMSGSMVHPIFMGNIGSPHNTSMNQEKGPHTPLTPHSNNVSPLPNSTGINYMEGSGSANQSLSSPFGGVPVNDTVPFDTFDDTPARGTRLLQDIYQRAPRMTEEEVQDQYQQAGLLLLNEEPTTFLEATKETQWMEAMRAEIDSIEKNQTWTLTRLPPNQKVIGLKWVFKLKRDASGTVARMESIRLILALAAKENWIVHHLDVKSAFLNGELKEEVYVTQPTGFEVKGKEEMVYKLHKALYGLRQAPRSWNAKLDKVLKELGFRKCAQDQAVYKLQSKNTTLIIGVYVDDIIVTGSSEKQIQEFKVRMNSIFEMSDLGKLNYYLGIEVKQEENGIIIKQESYARKILEEADIEDRRGTTRMVFYYSQNPVTWASHKQQTVALSSCEAEFMAATAAACQALWLRNMVSFLTGEEAQRVQLLVDNQSAIALMKNPVFHGRSKHIDTKYHFIREWVERDQVYVEHVSGDLQKADILTKALPRVKFAEMRRLIGTEDVNIKGENVV
ncbi:zinc finger, CCHC-type containing protein [Tanacetum coccineum]